MIEMLLQSSPQEINLLPALPDEWANGSVSGIRARGGFEIAMQWQNKQLKTVSITANKNSHTVLVSGNKKHAVDLKQGQTLELEW